MTLFLVDTSVLARSSAPHVKVALRALISSRSAATCATVDLEVGYSARSMGEAEAVALRRSLDYRNLPITETIADRAREVQLQLARTGLHRSAGIIDLLTAAVAEHHGATLLHYDADFDHIASVTGQSHRWVVPRGSL